MSVGWLVLLICLSWFLSIYILYFLQGELRVLLQVCRGPGEAGRRREEVHRGEGREDHCPQEEGELLGVPKLF